MQLDIYRRSEPDHKLSYLAVPAGKPIPDEATNVEWLEEARALDLDEDSPDLEGYAIESAGQQILEKGYAITSVEHQVEAGS
ncbi:MAG TPA: DUF6139 family protein [Polaromonas sp.]|uniref:DUF6139 family protein n=1 Tax=Polaromonas sp. TaxID=1869339 RepID=UPI002D751E2E|nr:DUF6139 family protein [Polaromonas sp.]HYW56210.1 DUF6139 family protein [Polaromonas sp.]